MHFVIGFVLIVCAFGLFPKAFVKIALIGLLLITGGMLYVYVIGQQTKNQQFNAPVVSTVPVPAKKCVIPNNIDMTGWNEKARSDYYTALGAELLEGCVR